MEPLSFGTFKIIFSDHPMRQPNFNSIGILWKSVFKIKIAESFFVGWAKSYYYSRYTAVISLRQIVILLEPRRAPGGRRRMERWRHSTELLLDIVPAPAACTLVIYLTCPYRRENYPSWATKGSCGGQTLSCRVAWCQVPSCGRQRCEERRKMLR